MQNTIFRIASLYNKETCIQGVPMVWWDDVPIRGKTKVQIHNCLGSNSISELTIAMERKTFVVQIYHLDFGEDFGRFRKDCGRDGQKRRPQTLGWMKSQEDLGAFRNVTLNLQLPAVLRQNKREESEEHQQLYRKSSDALRLYQSRNKNGKEEHLTKDK